MNMNDWVAYWRFAARSSSDMITIIQRADERPPKYFLKRETAPTVAEIQAELARRAQVETTRQVYREFESRQDYQDAKAIAAALEHMEPHRHPLDCLTPAEWAAFRQKLGV